MLAALADDESARNQIYNVAVSGRTDLNQLFNAIKKHLAMNGVTYNKSPVYREFRAGDVRHSQADISKARQLLGYFPEFDIDQGTFPKPRCLGMFHISAGDDGFLKVSHACRHGTELAA